MCGGNFFTNLDVVDNMLSLMMRSRLRRQASNRRLTSSLHKYLEKQRKLNDGSKFVDLTDFVMSDLEDENE